MLLLLSSFQFCLSLLAARSVSPFGCLHLCETSSAHLYSFFLHFLLHPHHCLRPSLWSFCCRAHALPILSHKKKAFALGRPSAFLPSSYFWPFFISINNRLMMSSSHFLHHFTFLYFTFFFFFFFLFFHFSSFRFS